MLCTKQKVLRRFWYATVPVDKLDDGPKPFTLLGEKIVLFLDGEGKPAALADRCCHRTAQAVERLESRTATSPAAITAGPTTATGKLVRIPQFAAEQPLPDARVKAFHCDARYGYVWVALERAARCHPRLAARIAIPPIGASTSSTIDGIRRRCG